jgi:hypothetical protein
MKTITKIRKALLVFIVLLVLSGVTAFPLKAEMDYLLRNKDVFPTFLTNWIQQVHLAVHATPDAILYGTDWLAFAHIIIALFFIPVYLNPVKYKVNLEIAMVACLAIFPLAFICGPIRNIPFFHQLIDCSFGLIGILVLFFIHQLINKLNPSTYEITQ